MDQVFEGVQPSSVMFVSTYKVHKAICQFLAFTNLRQGVSGLAPCTLARASSGTAVAVDRKKACRVRLTFR